MNSGHNPKAPCRWCNNSSHCCSRVSKSGELPPPFVFPFEVDRIASLAPNGGALECGRTLASDEVWTLKATERGCVFSVAGACQIYENRPLDCRLFPFDIREGADGSLVWICYERMCGLSEELPAAWAKARALLISAAPTFHDLRNYARYARAQLAPLPFVELGAVDLVEFPNAA